VRNVRTVSTSAADGWADDAPYDVIMLNGSTEFVPDAWLNQLAPGGRLGVIVRNGPVGSARIYTRSGEATAYRTAFDAAPPVAPGLERPPAFAF
jgi:protein-L-isoaspartate(D-aspartate) O-methyltransferase